MEYSLQRRYKTLSTKKTLILSRPAGRKEGFHPSKDMKVEELRVEWSARGNCDEGNKEDLQKRLSELLGEQQDFLHFCTAMKTLMSQSKN